MARKTARLTADLDANTSRFKTGMDGASKSLNKFGQNVQNTSKRSSASMMALNSTSGVLASSLGVLASAFSVQKIVSYSDAYKQLQSKLALVTKSTSELETVTQQLFDISQQNKQPIEATVEAYSRLNQSLTETQKKSVDLVKFTDLLSKTLLISGTSAEGAKTFFQQFGQAASSDFKAIGQELQTFADQNPKFYGILKDEANRYGKSLKDMAKDGELSFEFIQNAVTNATDSIESDAARINKTFGQSLTKLQNSFTMFIGKSDSVTGAVNLLADAAGNLSEIFDYLSQDSVNLNATLAGLAVIPYDIAKAYNELGATIAENTNFFGIRDETVKEYEDKAKSIQDIIDGFGERVLKFQDDIAAAKKSVNDTSVLPKDTKTDNTIIQKLELPTSSKGGRGSKKDANDFIGQLRLESQELEIQTSLYGKKGSAIDRATRQLKLNNQITQAGIVLTKEQQKQVDLYLTKIEQQTDLQEMQAKQQRELEDAERSRKQALDNLAASFEGAFEDAIVSGAKLSDVLGGLAQDILRLTIRRSIVTPLVNSIFGDGGGSGIFSSLLGGSFATGIDNVPRDMLAMVHKGESVIPRQQADGMRGGGDVTVNIVNTAGAQVSSSSQETSSGVDLNIMIDKAVADNIGRAGSRTSQALGAVKNRTLIRR